MAGMQSVALLIEVKGGLVPGEEEPGLTKRFVLSHEELDEISGKDVLIAGRSARADSYARYLRDMGAVKWVSTCWVDLR